MTLIIFQLLQFRLSNPIPVAFSYLFFQLLFQTCIFLCLKSQFLSQFPQFINFFIAKCQFQQLWHFIYSLSYIIAYFLNTKKFLVQIFIIILNTMNQQQDQEMTQYEKFRLIKLANKHQEDNLSAHFSNMSANISIFTKSERDIQLNSFRTSMANEQEIEEIKKQLKQRNRNFDDLADKYFKLQKQHRQLAQKFKNQCLQTEKYKNLYQSQINRERQTKQKLKNWVKQAKGNLKPI